MMSVVEENMIISDDKRVFIENLILSSRKAHLMENCINIALLIKTDTHLKI